MRVLVLGGGGFLGFHAAAEALLAGHEVTVLSRSGEAPMADVEVVTGDRMDPDSLGELRGREWDAAFDTFNDTRPGAPAIATTARLLSGAVGGYAYVSGMSVYAPAGPAVPDETGPVRRAGVEPDTDRLQERSLAKLAGEAAVREGFDGVALFPRVGIMVGPRGRRFNYWPVRIAKALTGELSRTIAVPGDPDRTVQYSDARDISAWSWRMLEQGRGGVFNTVGPCRPDTFAEVLEACRQAAGAGPDDITWAVRPDEDRLRDQLAEVDEEDRPLWYPEDQIPQLAIDSNAAAQAGLVFRPAVETARDILRWATDEGDPSLTDSFEPYESAILAE